MYYLVEELEKLNYKLNKRDEVKEGSLFIVVDTDDLVGEVVTGKELTEAFLKPELAGQFPNLYYDDETNRLSVHSHMMYNPQFNYDANYNTLINNSQSRVCVELSEDGGDCTFVLADKLIECKEMDGYLTVNDVTVASFTADYLRRMEVSFSFNSFFFIGKNLLKLGILINADEDDCSPQFDGRDYYLSLYFDAPTGELCYVRCYDFHKKKYIEEDSIFSINQPKNAVFKKAESFFKKVSASTSKKLKELVG